MASIFKHSPEPSSLNAAVVWDESAALMSVATHLGPLVIPPPFARGLVLEVINLSSSGAGTCQVQLALPDIDGMLGHVIMSSIAVAVGTKDALVSIAWAVADLDTLFANVDQTGCPMVFQPRVVVATAPCRFRVAATYLL